MENDDIARERVAALDRLVLAEIARIDESFEAFERSVTERFVAGNEFRASLADMQSQMATRREVEAFQVEYRNAHANLLASVAELRTLVAVGPTELRQLARQEAITAGRQLGVTSIFNNPLLAAALIAAAGVIGHFIK